MKLISQSKSEGAILLLRCKISEWESVVGYFESSPLPSSLSPLLPEPLMSTGGSQK